LPIGFIQKTAKGWYSQKQYKVLDVIPRNVMNDKENDFIVL